MRTKLLLQTPVVILLLLVSLAASTQPVPQSTPGVNPATGLPVLPVPSARPTVLQNPAPLATIDPATGMPVVQTSVADQQWIDPSWTDPNIVLTNISYDNLPLSEVARDLRERFKNYFDILPMPRTFDRDWGSEIAIQLQMKNIKASDVFSAMNLVFENDRTPLRWELKAAGFNRRVVLLRVLPEGAPQLEQMQHKPVETRRMVFFIGNLIGDEKSGGMTMNQIFNTFSAVWPSDFGKPDSVIQFHEQAQLIVVNGTREQIDFIQQTLEALQKKANADAAKKILARSINAGPTTDMQKQSDLMRQRESDQPQKIQKTGSGGDQ